MSTELERSRRLIQSIQDEELKEKILEVLPQGHGSGLDADLLDGLHAAEIIAKSIGRGGGGGGGGTTLHGVSLHDTTVREKLLSSTLGMFNPFVAQYYPSLSLSPSSSIKTDVLGDVLHAVYYPTFRKMRFDRIAINVASNGGVGALARLGIWTDENFKPKNLVLDCGEILCETAGFKIRVIDETLEVGAHWLSIVLNNNLTDLHYPNAYFPLGASYGAYDRCRYDANFSYAPLPDTFPEEGWYDVEPYKLILRVAEVLD
jgi:hypothetical protein